MIVRCICLAVVVFSSTACVSQYGVINPDYELGVSEAEYEKRLKDWFNCDECANGQLRRVQELGNRAVSDLEDARNGMTIEIGGSPLTIADSDAAITKRCTSVATVPVGWTPARTVAQCEDRFKANRDRRYRARADVALLAIRTKSACTALGVDTNGNAVCKLFPPFEMPEFNLDTERSTRYMVR